jgi:CheY-like chemotaxis protein
VVDDNATNRFVAREMLLGWGATVAEASDGWDALEQLRAREGEPPPFDLALIDFQMPEMDGGQLAERILKDHVLAELPLVLLSSVPLHGDAVSMMKLGFDAYLTKPVRQAALHDAIVAVVGRREATTAHGALRLVASRPQPRSRPRVLLLETDTATARPRREACEVAGCSVRIAADAAAAVAACGEESFDVVLLGADSLPAARRIRERLPPAGAPAIVAIADAGTSLDPSSPGADVDAVLAAPVAAEDILRLLSRFAPRTRASAQE